MHPRLATLLKSRSFIFSSVVVTVILGLAVAVLAVRASSEQPKIVGQIKPEDVRNIRQAISRAQWPTARTCFTKKQYQRFFRFFYRDLLTGGLLEIHSRSGPAGDIAQVQGPTATYMLQHTTNGWQVVATGFRK